MTCVIHLPVRRAYAPLLRLGNERINENSLQYVVPNVFAGSIFDLEPGMEYECRFVLTDPDGVEGKSENIVTLWPVLPRLAPFLR